MNRTLVDRLVNALLYEGYLLYPYRPSVKNRQRWSFGGLYPPSYTNGRPGADASAMQTQCLLHTTERTGFTGSVRFLQLIARRVGAFEAPDRRGGWPVDESTLFRFVEALRVGDAVLSPWQEAIEREISLGEIHLAELESCPRRFEFAFGPGVEREPVRDPTGAIVGFLDRRLRRIEGRVDVAAERLKRDLARITVRVENRTVFDPGSSDDRDEVLMHTLASTHTCLGALHGGGWVSALDPPEGLRELAASCRNEGTWPVLVGEAGEVDTLLSSPIILYDYPQIASESPGDLFDATEIDEILTLRIMTLSDEEKRSMATLDDRGRALLERTEALAREQLMGLHGTMREVR